MPVIDRDPVTVGKALARKTEAALTTRRRDPR
jgi:hypothetical protein